MASAREHEEDSVLDETRQCHPQRLVGHQLRGSPCLCELIAVGDAAEDVGHKDKLMERKQKCK